MPIYEYFCPDCNSRFELLRPLDKASEKALCPQCKKSVRRIFSAFAFSSKNSEGMLETSAVASSPCATCAATSCASCSSKS